uniref:Uncharacterized protein n=1 Tax=Arundo donax TaxID=35708 RepID=A0A0A9FG29_ARUDO
MLVLDMLLLRKLCCFSTVVFNVFRLSITTMLFLAVAIFYVLSFLPLILDIL